MIRTALSSFSYGPIRPHKASVDICCFTNVYLCMRLILFNRSISIFFQALFLTFKHPPSPDPSSIYFPLCENTTAASAIGQSATSQII